MTDEVELRTRFSCAQQQLPTSESEVILRHHWRKIGGAYLCIFFSEKSSTPLSRWSLFSLCLFFSIYLRSKFVAVIERSRTSALQIYNRRIWGWQILVHWYCGSKYLKVLVRYSSISTMSAINYSKWDHIEVSVFWFLMKNKQIKMLFRPKSYCSASVFLS